MLVQDEIKGLRGSRVVPITGAGDDEWRSDVSEPMLLSKVQTALAILIDQNPDATFKALNEKFKRNTAFAYSLWKRSWIVAKSKDQLKLCVFDLAKYGWCIGRTYPRYISRKGKVLVDREGNKFLIKDASKDYHTKFGFFGKEDMKKAGNLFRLFC